MADLFFELLQLLLNTEVHLLDQIQANGAAAIRVAIDEAFKSAGNWTEKKSGGIDWSKQMRYNSTLIAKIGVEVHVSARSDLLVRDVVHLRNSLQLAEIDVGVIVVPDDRMQKLLPDRTPCFSDAVRYIEKDFPEAMNYPIIVVAVEQDGPSGKPLPKRRKSDSP
ncbi:MAG: hypothetical protein SFV23_06880 [Planctomycetaceae bacterium]|nr:hypothetical protein [Planctomycetaceae bacterium]